MMDVLHFEFLMDSDWNCCCCYLLESLIHGVGELNRLCVELLLKEMKGKIRILKREKKCRFLKREEVVVSLAKHIFSFVRKMLFFGKTN